jgi:hypothetical protein
MLTELIRIEIQTVGIWTDTASYRPATGPGTGPPRLTVSVSS